MKFTKLAVSIGIASLILSGAALLSPKTVDAASSVRGYYKKNTSTYVAPHYRSTRNTTRFDNYSTRGNYNPYTGKKGYTSPYKVYKPSYRSYRW